MKVFFMTMIVLAVSGTLRAEDLLDSVLKAPSPAPAPLPAQSVSTPAPRPSAVEASNSAPTAPESVPPVAQPPKSDSSENKTDGNAKVKDKPGPARRVQVHFDPSGTRITTRKSKGTDSSAKARKPGGVSACCVGCCFGRRAALDYNDGKSISPREWAECLPFISFISRLATCIDAYGGATRSVLHDEAPAYY